MLISLIACNKAKIDGWKIANEFHSKHANEFIENNELLRYSYSPRMQFDLQSESDTVIRAHILKDNTMLLLNLNLGTEYFLSEFGIELDSSFSMRSITITITKTKGLLTFVANDSVPIKVLSYKIDPLEYFTNLKADIEKYKIVTYHKLRIGEIVEVYLTGTSYLLYFPEDLNIKEPHFEDYWIKKKARGKKLDKNWYYYESDKPLDFG